MSDTLTPPPAAPPPGDRIIDEPLTEALSRRYLAYALSVITDRALPDVRDGLKPVQRRIADAMATSIPPHNAAELIDACLLLLEKPEATTLDLMTHAVQGPDFPTGGVIVEPRQSLIDTYETGRGGVRLRALWTKEALGNG